MNITPFLAIYYVGINLLLFIMMGVDKRKAVRNRFRIPERSLFAAAFLGGGFGGFVGMQIFRHKSRKPLFWFVYGLGVAGHAVFLAWLYMKGH